ncbi:hypothetical protein ABH908_005172 [Pseudomonas frederiksbergensis]|jgi:hypothetical protein|uniref:phage tail assembly chaperone n=1 Tax=Pseudomonas TaxID=286 RepID=UPI00110EB156|nr:MULTISPECIES: phage tail assembly chaperone [unclassified Pseudomonas]MBD9620173.1 phage tail protein [Pseudomonas sp. PDM07]QDV97328.1 phage tail protein [Pseudomonas sp. ATCC 43928]CAH0289618.1 hypothetical protein SRABI130_04311 [Pseudomonas sp. Bi130]
MQRFYSQSTGCTYLQGFHTQMPEDAKPIAEEHYQAVLANPVPGKVRGHDADGLPMLVDPSPEDLAATERAWRNCEILRVQWIRDRYRDEQELSRPPSITSEQYSGLLDYMQMLRDWPEQQEFPAEQFRPVPPAWIVKQTQ